jgi:hypothetical protein
MASLVQALVLVRVLSQVPEPVFYPSNRHTYFYLHIFFLYPVTILLEDLGQLWICPLEEDHQNIESSEKTKWWLTRPDNLSECAMSRKWGLIPNITVTMGTKDTRVTNRNNHFTLHLILVKKLSPAPLLLLGNLRTGAILSLHLFGSRCDTAFWLRLRTT